MNTVPLIFHSDFKDCYNPIIYFFSIGTYSTFKHLRVVDFYNHIPTSINENWKPYFSYDLGKYNYAFGININTFHSKILALDLDHHDYEKLNMYIDHFLNQSNTIAIDLIKSSIRGHHLIVGFDDYYNIINFYNQSSLPNICPGFINCIRRSNEITLRVSNKMYNDGKPMPSSLPEYKCSFRKINNKWTKFNSEGYNIIIFPSKDIQQPKPVLNLRKKYKLKD